MTDKKYPEKLRTIKNPPQKLYVMGDANLLNKQSIAIVGSRDASEYGKKYAALFSNSIAHSNIAVVSGLAVGIDSIAHQNAMKEKGKTIAAIASGFSHMYPKENIPLYQAILKNGGCIVSEYPPETKPNMQAFPMRNRIIAGLSMAVIVIEAKHRSGSSITARHALQQKKQVFCLPHSIEDKNGVGCNRLLKNGAKIITKASELQNYLSITIKDTNPFKESTQSFLPITSVEQDYQPIYQVLLNGPMDNNQLAQTLKCSISHVNQMLTIMELKGYIEAIPGNEFQIKQYTKGIEQK